MNFLNWYTYQKIIVINYIEVIFKFLILLHNNFIIIHSFCHRIYIALINYIAKMNIKHIKKRLNYYILNK